jgi:hypothetical protein
MDRWRDREIEREREGGKREPQTLSREKERKISTNREK